MKEPSRVQSFTLGDAWSQLMDTLAHSVNRNRKVSGADEPGNQSIDLSSKVVTVGGATFLKETQW